MADDIDTLNPEFNLDELSEDGELPSTENLMKMLEESNMTDEMKENLRQMLSGGRAPELFGASTSGSWLGVVFIIVIFSILFFFGYKLYKSIKEKENKKEEKKKLKQMKKKK